MPRPSAAVDLEAAGEGGDQRQADPQARALDVGAGADAAAGVAHDDGQALVLRARLDLERPGPSSVGVDDDVHAGLGDDRLQVGDARFVHAELLGQPGECVADDRDVRRPRGQRD